MQTCRGMCTCLPGATDNYCGSQNNSKAAAEYLTVVPRHGPNGRIAENSAHPGDVHGVQLEPGDACPPYRVATFTNRES
jgi:hypothetical protein